MIGSNTCALYKERYVLHPLFVLCGDRVRRNRLEIFSRMACIVDYSFLIIIALFWMGHGSDAVSISINPEKSIATMGNDVDISCVPDSGDDKTKEIVLLEISKNDGQLIAALRPCSNITYGSDVVNRIQVIGHIDDDVRKSYLNVTLTSPVSTDTGIYTCSMHYLEQADLKEEKKWKNLLIENLNVSSLETVLNSLKERLTVLEEDGMKNAMEKIKTLENTVTYNSAFSVGTHNSKHFYPTIGKAIVFPRVILNEGAGYNNETGMYTAPKAGLYFFNVVALTWTGHKIDLELRANEQVLARMYVEGEKHGDQSSITTVTPLAVGDVVKVVPTSVRVGSFLYRAYSLFTGYFIKPLN